MLWIQGRLQIAIPEKEMIQNEEKSFVNREDVYKRQAYRTYEKNEAGCICFRRKGKNDFYSEREQI